MDQGLTPAEAAALKREISAALHCALPGTVEAFDPENRTAAVRPALEGMPLLRDVPVFMPVPFPVNPGDGCLLVFADRDTEDPAGGRRHSLSDAFAFVGFRTIHNSEWR